MERIAVCPSCERPVRLTEDELFAKRSFCARCDAQFDLQPGMLTDLPVAYRDPATELVVAQPPPPSSRLTLVTDGETTSLTVASAHTGSSASGATARPSSGRPSSSWARPSALLARSAHLFIPAWIFWLVMVVPTALILGGIARVKIRDRFGRDRLEIRDGSLWYRRTALLGGRWKRIPLASIALVSVDRGDLGDSIRIVQRGPERRKLRIDGLGHDAQTFEWIRSWIRREANASVKADLPPALPAPHMP